MSLNAQQQLAVSELDKSMSISAGAGSGKTRVLVERFWNLVESGQVRVDEILAVTFTRKAAHELIDRVRKRIDESDWNEIQKMNLKENLSRAYIGTIHSFCTRLLKENPVEAGVDPYFRVIEELDGAQLLQHTVEEVVLDQVRTGDTGTLALVELAGYNSLCLELQKLTRIMINKGLKLDQIEKTTWESLAHEEKQISNRIIKINQPLTALAELLPQVDSKSKTYSAVQEIAANYKQWSALMATKYNSESQELAELLAHLQELCKQLKARVVKDTADDLKQALEEMTGYLADKQTIAILEVVFRLLNMIAESFHFCKDKENILEFSDLEEKAVNLLSNHLTLLQRYQNQFRHIMVDEFQDTNHRQTELVNMLAGGQHPGKLFLVGDPKQSIYRFRGAEVGLFAEISEQIKGQGGLIHSLDQNYRSREQVIGIINNLFVKLMPAGSGYQFQKLIAGRKNTLVYPQTEVHLLKQGNSSELERDEAEAECLALRIREIVGRDEVLVSETKAGQETLRTVHYGDIALLFRTTRDMSTFANVFANYDIPAYIVGSRGFYQTEEVRAVILALQVVDNRSNELAWAGLLRSPIFGVADEALWLMKQAESSLEEAMTRLDSIVGIEAAEQSKIHLARSVIIILRQLNNRLSLVELIDLLLKRTGFEYLLAMRPNGNHMIANLNKLKRLAASYNQENYSNLNGFLNFIAKVREADAREPEAATETENGDTVKMMTVHQAKGLEFPVVIISEMHRKFNFQDISGFSVISEDYGVFLKTPNHKGWLRQKAEAAERLKLEEEYKRLLYVAMTRARDYLILSGCYRLDSQGMVKTESSSWLNWFFDQYGVKEEPFTGMLEQAGLRVFNYLQADISAAENILTGQFPNQAENEIDAFESIIAAPREHPYRQVFSATAVMDYSFCQRYYYLKHLAGIPETTAGEEYKNEIIVHNLRADRMGTLVHQAIERGKDLAGAREVLGKLVKGIARGKTRELILNELEPMLVSYYENKSIQSLTKKYGVQKEVPFLARINQHTYLKGFIDQLFEDTDQVVIADLKTSQVSSPNKLEKKVQQYTVQLNVYEEAVKKIMGPIDADKRLLFLRTGQIVRVPSNAVNTDLSGTRRTASPDDCKKCGYYRLCRTGPEQ